MLLLSIHLKKDDISILLGVLCCTVLGVHEGAFQSRNGRGVCVSRGDVEFNKNLHFSILSIICKKKRPGAQRRYKRGSACAGGISWFIAIPIDSPTRVLQVLPGRNNTHCQTTHKLIVVGCVPILGSSRPGLGHLLWDKCCVTLFIGFLWLMSEWSQWVGGIYYPFVDWSCDGSLHQIFLSITQVYWCINKTYQSHANLQFGRIPNTYK
jgi:hypothetical protein